MYLVLAVSLIGIAGAQSGDRPDPADPSVPGAVFRYESAFEGYQDVQDRKLTPWKDANEEMRRLGGHAGHARPGASTDGAERKPTSPQPPAPGGKEDSVPSGHGMDHKMDHTK
jgi:hypothetical protein